MSFIQIDGYEPKHLSFSTVDGYRSCAKRTYLQKVLRVEQRPGLAGIGGNAVHTATEEVDKLILEHGWSVLDEDDTPVFIEDDTPAPF